MLVGIPNSSLIYYFFTDPNDECPAGFGTGSTGDGVIQGYVLDNETLQPINNVSVSAGIVSNYTNANGFYNITTQFGTIKVIGVKTGYNTYVNDSTVNLAQTINFNFSMGPFQGTSTGAQTFANGTVEGYVTSNSTGAALQALMSIAGQAMTASAAGFYNFTLTNGTHTLTATARDGDADIALNQEGGGNVVTGYLS